MTYQPILSVNCETGETTEIPMTDELVLSLYGAQIKLTTDKATITADSVDAATITAQLCTAELVTTQEPENIVESRDVDLIINNDPDEVATISLIDGVGTWQLAAALAGDYVVRGHDLVSNELTITATEA